MPNENLKMIRGDTLAFGFELDGVTEVDGVHFSVKKTKHEDEYILQKTLNNGVEQIEDGKYSVRVAPSDTHNLEVGTYYYDLQIMCNGDIFTVLYGTLEIEADITRDNTSPAPAPPTPTPSIIKTGWYYFLLGEDGVQAFNFNVENNILYNIFFSQEAIASESGDYTGAFMPFTLDGNTITTDDITFNITDDGVLSIPEAEITAEYSEHLDIEFIREVNNG